MSNASEEEEGNLLQNVKAFYTKGSFKSASEKRNEDSSTTPEKTPHDEVVSPARGKRRRIKCKRYSGFVAESFKRNELPKPSLSLLNSPLKSPPFSAADTTVSCPKSRKQQKVGECLELVDPEVVTARQKRTLTVPLHRLVDYQGLDTPSEGLAVQKTVEAARESENRSLLECPNTGKSPGVCNDLGGLSVPQSSSNVNNAMPLNSAKLKRKHALCAIFEDIWNPKNSDAAEKPQINGFKQMFHDVFNKAPQVRAQNAESSPKGDSVKTAHVSSHATNDNHTQIIKKEVSSEERNHSEPSQAPLTPTETKPFEVNGCLLSEVIISDLQLSHEVEVETVRSGESSSPSDTEDNPLPERWLKSAQSKCTAQSKLVSLQLIIRKTVLPVPMVTEHRKKRKRRCRKRKTQRHVTDADDEHSDTQSSQPKPCPLLTGPLKLMTVEDLWIQKEFYLRYLCNYYHISSEGCKGWMISRLHQFILQSVGSSSLSKHKTFKLCGTPQQRSNRSVSWVKLNVECKTKFLDE